MWIPLPITGFLGARRMKNEERQASVVPKRNSSLVITCMAMTFKFVQGGPDHKALEIV